MISENTNICVLPRLIKDREKNKKYINSEGIIIIWSGKYIHCEHNKRKERCVICDGKEISDNNKNKIKNQTMISENTNICVLPRLIKDREKNKKYINSEGIIVIWTGKYIHCEHNKKKERCLVCNGKEICIHKKRKEICKLCGGSQICIHQRIRSECKQCFGGSICCHGYHKYICKICIGNGICEHNIQKAQCKQCGGQQFCIHNKRKSKCKQCNGSQICSLGKEKYICKICIGTDICIHLNYKSRCKICCPEGHLTDLMRSRVFSALKYGNIEKKNHTMELVGCSPKFLYDYLEKNFDENMSWENQGEYWHIDHRRPCASFDLSIEEEQKKCFHYTNLQPMEGGENLSKGDKYDEETFDKYWKNDIEGWVDK